jgi:hypothetical protein
MTTDPPMIEEYESTLRYPLHNADENARLFAHRLGGGVPERIRGDAQGR